MLRHVGVAVGRWVESVTGLGSVMPERTEAGAMRPGDASRTLRELREQLQDVGPWIVSVGEPEGCCYAAGARDQNGCKR